MNLMEFNKKFPSEQACKEYWKTKREKEGLVCPKCGCYGKEHFRWKGYREQWECKECGHRIGLRAGTVMQASKLPFMDWFLAFHLLTSTKKSLSSKELQRQLGRKRYQPVWEMVNKIHDVMGKRDSQYKLDGEMELDDAFIATDRVEEEKLEDTKRGRGSQDRTPVLVMTESRTVEGSKKRIKKQLGHVKMLVLPDLKAGTITDVLKGSADGDAMVMTDKSSSYTRFKECVKLHASQVIEPKDIGKVLPWVHIVISNAKRLLLDIYHHVSVELLQGYLNEFCYKLKSKRSYSLILPLVGIIIGTLLQLLETYWLNTHFGGGFGVKLSSIVYCTSVIVFLFSKKLDMAYNCAENILSRTIRYIGQLSFGIYLIHVYFLFVLLHFWPHPNFYLLWIVVVLLSVASVILGKKIFGVYAEKYFGFR